MIQRNILPVDGNIYMCVCVCVCVLWNIYNYNSYIDIRSDVYIYVYFWRETLGEPDIISDVLLWTPTHGRAKAGRPAWTCIQQLCKDTGCSPEDLSEAMNDREKWRERVRDIHATSTTWWYIYIYIYIYILFVSKYYNSGIYEICIEHTLCLLISRSLSLFVCLSICLSVSLSCSLFLSCTLFLFSLPFSFSLSLPVYVCANIYRYIHICI